MSITYALRILVFIVIAVAIFGILYWLTGYIAAEAGLPFGHWLQVAVVVLGALVLIGFLLHMLGVKVFKNDSDPVP